MNSLLLQKVEKVQSNQALTYTGLYTSDEVKLGEHEVAKILGIELFELMERAGHALDHFITLLYPNVQRVLICCGSGNNGGDGYVLADLLRERGIQVTLWQPGKAPVAGDAARARKIWCSGGGSETTSCFELPEGIDLIVDSLLGTGLRGKVRSPIDQLIELINRAQCPVLSVDIPSGLCADTGRVLGRSVRADSTLSFIALKRGLLTGQSRDWIGQLYLADLDIGQAFSRYDPPTRTFMDISSVCALLPHRAQSAHKGSCGRVLCVGGDEGMGGAIILASEGAARSGAGLISALTRDINRSPLLSRRPEVMVKIEYTKEQFISADSWVLGPGLGVTDWGKNLLDQANGLVKIKPTVKLLLDADALNLIAQDPARYQALYQGQNERIITPHPGEAARLLEWTIAEVEHDRFAAARALSLRYHCVTILKGSGTLIDDGQRVWVSGTGHYGMASGGMGDVLSGLLGGLLAQGMNAREAACLGAWLHGRTADLLQDHYDPFCLLAGDVARHLSQAFDELRSYTQ